MQKRGQITVFIILGTILIGSLFFLVYFNMDKGLDDLPEDTKSSIIKVQVESCIKQNADPAIFLLGINGGYSEDYLESFSLHYDSGIDYVPSLETMEKELSNIIRSGIMYCIDDLDQDITTLKDMKVDTKIFEDSIFFEVDVPIIINKSTSESRIDKFSYTFNNIDLKNIHEANQKVIDVQKEFGTDICLTCLSEIGTEHDLEITAINEIKDLTIFVITDNNTIINEQPYNFAFAARYGELDE